MRTKHLFICSIVIALLGAIPAQANKDDVTIINAVDLANGVRLLAENVKKTLKGRSETDILVGKFSGPPINQDSSGGPGIADMLREALEKLDVKSNRTATFSISGTYRPVPAKDGRMRIKFEGEYEHNKNFRKFGKWSMTIGVGIKIRVGQKVEIVQAPADVAPEKLVPARPEGTINDAALLFGVSTTLPAQLPGVDREKQFFQAISQPQLHLANGGERLSTTKTSPYGIGILTYDGGLVPANADPGKLSYSEFPVENDQGFAFANLERERSFAIRLFNDSKHFAAVSIHLDGLSVFSFADGREKPKLLIVPPGESIVHYGWYRNRQRVDAFNITEFGKGAAQQLNGAAEKVGQITVAFRAAWEQGAEPPADEAFFATRGHGNAIGRGAALRANFKPWKGTPGVIREIISLRYNRGDLD